MIGLLSVLLLAETPTQCVKTDAVCWAQLYEQETVKSTLLQSGYDAAKRLAALNDQRAEVWKKTAIDNAPRPPTVFTSPVFWLAVGFVVGAGSAIAITFAVNQSR